MWLLLANPTSGGGKGARLSRMVSEYLVKQNIVFREISGGSFRESAKNLKDNVTAQPSELLGVIVVGGDGMVHLAVQELAGTEIPLAVIPAGTGNDLARALNLPLNNPELLIGNFLNRKPTKVDLGKVNGRIFAGILSTGFDSIVNERANRMTMVKGRMKYNAAILLELPTFKPKTYEFRIDGITFTTKAMLIAVSNGISYGGGMKVTPEAKIDDGLFDVMVLGPVSKIEFLRVFPKVFSGGHVNHPAVKILRGKEVEINADAVAYADGERIGELPIHAEVLPESLLTWRL